MLHWYIINGKYIDSILTRLTSHSNGVSITYTMVTIVNNGILLYLVIYIYIHIHGVYIYICIIIWFVVSDGIFVYYNDWYCNKIVLQWIIAGN